MPIFAMLCGTSLQWGRVLTNAESSFETPVGQRVMWLQWGRVLTNAERDPPLARAHPDRPRFNGAAFSRTRKVIMASSDSLDYLALQWGRVLTNAES